MQLPATARRYIRFGPYAVDFVAREVRNGSGRVTLQDKPFQILAILLEQPGDLVTREQLRERLWPADTYVDFDHSINTAIKKLREALENHGAETGYIETLPKRGYRFIGAVEEEPAEQQISKTQEDNVSPLEEPRRRLPVSRWLLFLTGAVVGLMVLLVALNAFGSRDALRRQWNTMRGIPAPIHSVAVLPLQNLSQDPEQEYFADGLTDALITDLGKVSSLRVISRTSVLRYKQSKQPVSQIARELDVDAIVEGTVLRSGDQLRVTVQLIRVSPEEHLWAERYERDVEEILPLEKQLAVAIAHEVTGRLTTSQETALSQQPTTNPKAYEAYLRGRYLWKDRTQQAAAGAAMYFEQAVREDPTFALAYSGLADYYAVGWGAWVNVPLAITYARKAVELGPNLAETHASLGIASQYQCNFADAGRELQRAVELNPNYAMAHHWYAIHLMGMGKMREALAENDQARQLDPFSLPINFYRTNILLHMSQYQQAKDQVEVLEAISPSAAARMRASLYWAEGRVPEAIEEEKRAHSIEVAVIQGQPPRYWDVYGRTFAAKGKQAADLMAAQRGERACMHSAQVDKDDSSCDAGGVAVLYHAAGDREKTLYWLERGIADSRASRDGQCWVGNSLELDFPDLRSDPRFQGMLRSLGLPEN